MARWSSGTDPRPPLVARPPVGDAPRVAAVDEPGGWRPGREPPRRRPAPAPVPGRVAWLVAVALGAVSPPAPCQAAEDDSLDALFQLSVSELLSVPVTTATRQEQPRWRSPNAVSVVSGETLRRYGHRTLADVLQTVVGTIPGFDGWRDHLGLRGVFGEGTFDSRILWMVDGHRLNDGFFQGASPGETFPVDLAVIDHVEVIRGPGSSVYGSNAFFGVVNVVTRSPRQASGAALAVSAGGFLSSPAPQVKASDLSPVSDRRWTATIATEVGGVDVLASMAGRADEGRPIWIPYFTATGAGGVADRKDGLDADKLFVDLRAGRWRLLAGASRVSMTTPDASFGAEPDSPLNQAEVDAWFAEAQHEWSPTGGVALTSRLYLDRNVFLRDWHYQGYWPPDRQDVRSEWAGLEERVAWSAGPNRLLAGAELQFVRATQRELYPSEGAPGVPFTSRSAHDVVGYALFASDELEASPRWFLTGGLRLEGNQVDGAVLTGRAAVVFRPREATVLKLQVGEGFKNTSVHAYGYHSSELNLYQWQIRPLRRERVTSLEVVVSQVVDPVSLEVVLFRNQARRLITYDGPTDSYFNGPGLDVQGVEAELACTVAPRLSGYANWTWLWAENRDGAPTLNAPTWSAKAGVAVRLLDEDRLAAAAEGQLYGPADFEDFPASRPGVDLRQPAYGLVNVNLTGRVPALRLAWSLGVQNLLDASYAFPVAKGTREPFPGPGRRWHGSLELRY